MTKQLGLRFPFIESVNKITLNSGEVKKIVFEKTFGRPSRYHLDFELCAGTELISNKSGIITAICRPDFSYSSLPPSISVGSSIDLTMTVTHPIACPSVDYKFGLNPSTIEGKSIEVSPVTIRVEPGDTRSAVIQPRFNSVGQKNFSYQLFQNSGLLSQPEMSIEVTVD